MNKLKYHKSLNTISIHRLNEIKKSISDGKPEYRHLLVLKPYEDLPKISAKMLGKLAAVYIEMVKELPEVNTDLTDAYSAYLREYMKIRVFKIRQRIESMKGNRAAKESYTVTNQKFMNYLKILDANNTNFEVVEYYIDEDMPITFINTFDVEWTEEYEKFYNQIKIFYTVDRYLYEVRNLKVHDAFKQVFLSEQFMTAFVKSRFVQHTGIMPYYKRVEDEYLKNENYAGFLEFRHKVFGLQNMSFDPKYHYDFNEEVVTLERALKIAIDPHVVSAAKYFAYVKSVKAMLDKDQKEPKPA